MTDSIRDRLVAELVRLFGKHYLLYQLRPAADALLAAFPWLADEPRCCKHEKCPGGSLCCCQGLSEKEVEAGARALFEALVNSTAGHVEYSWAEMVADDPRLADIWRDDARTVLVGAREARTT